MDEDRMVKLTPAPIDLSRQGTHAVAFFVPMNFSIAHDSKCPPISVVRWVVRRVRGRSRTRDGVQMWHLPAISRKNVRSRSPQAERDQLNKHLRIQFSQEFLRSLILVRVDFSAFMWFLFVP